MQPLTTFLTPPLSPRLDAGPLIPSRHHSWKPTINIHVAGYNDVKDDPSMGWARYAHSMRVFVFNSGLFYIRPTQASIALLDAVAHRLATENGWDQAIFNEVGPQCLACPDSHSSSRSKHLGSPACWLVARTRPSPRKSEPGALLALTGGSMSVLRLENVLLGPAHLQRGTAPVPCLQGQAQACQDPDKWGSPARQGLGLVQGGQAPVPALPRQAQACQGARQGGLSSLPGH